MKIYAHPAAPDSMKVEDLDWKEVYDTFLPRIFHFFCYKVGDPQTAEDLTAATFEKAWVNRARYRKDLGQVGAWLFGIARHVAGDHFRRATREVSFNEAPEFPAADSIDEDFQRKLDFQRVSEILAQLPARERELVALKYGAELTNREISRLTGLSESNVGTILHRVIVRLRKEWEQAHG